VAGDAVTLEGLFFDAGAEDAHTFAWQVRDLANNLLYSATTQTLTFTPLVAGTYLATFTVTDDGLTSTTGSATTRVLIGNVGDPVDTSTPIAPSGLAASSANRDGVTINWTDNSSDEECPFDQPHLTVGRLTRHDAAHLEVSHGKGESDGGTLA